MQTRSETHATSAERNTVGNGSALRVFVLLLALVGGLAIVLLTTLSAAQAQSAPQYVFTKVADSTEDGLDANAFGCSAINDRGDIAFRAGRLSANGFNTNYGLYRANAGGGLTTIVQNAGRFGFINISPSINNRGWVSFAAGLDDDTESILRDNGPSQKTIASTTGKYEFFTFETSINDSNVVAFKSDLDEEFGFDEGLFSGKSSPATTRYLASRSRFLGSESRPSINNLGTIAFEERNDNAREGIWVTREGGGFRRVALADPEGFLSEPVLNDAGTIAFENNFVDESDTFVTEIVTWQSGSTTTIADTTGEFGSFGFRPPALNNDGAVAFLATLDSFETDGIYVASPGDATQQVISTDDPLDGRTIRNLVFCEEGLNDAGRLTFVAQLEDADAPDGFRAAVFRATPAP